MQSDKARSAPVFAGTLTGDEHRDNEPCAHKPRTYNLCAHNLWQAMDTLGSLIAGTLLTRATREALAPRLSQGSLSAYNPTLFTPQEYALLEAVSLQLVPHDPATLSLTSRIDARLTRGDTDGWRYDALPPDAEAYRQLLASLPADFQTMQDAAQHAALTQAQREHPKIFEELLAELTEGYYSNPQNQLEIGYVGFADAQGWQDTGLNQLDPHEREALTLAGKQP